MVIQKENDMADLPHIVSTQQILTYKPGTLTHCPTCSGTQWLVGRTTAQCAYCDTAMPLLHMSRGSSAPLFVSRFAKNRAA